MYWSYLSNSQKSLSSNILTFESTDNDLEIFSKGYCDLIINDFFSGFAPEYDTIFISEYGPKNNPGNKERKFTIKFTDVEKAKKYQVA